MLYKSVSLFSRYYYNNSNNYNNNNNNYYYYYYFHDCMCGCMVGFKMQREKEGR